MNFKKIAIVLAAVAAMLTAESCNKEEPVVSGGNNPVVPGVQTDGDDYV